MNIYQIFDHTLYIGYICVQGNQHHTKNGPNTRFDSISENYTDMQEKMMAKLRDIAPAARAKCDSGFTWFRIELLRFKFHICITDMH